MIQIFCQIYEAGYVFQPNGRGGDCAKITTKAEGILPAKVKVMMDVIGNCIDAAFPGRKMFRAKADSHNTAQSAMARNSSSAGLREWAFTEYALEWVAITGFPCSFAICKTSFVTERDAWDTSGVM